LVVVAPHPDDEILGAGGLIQRALSENVVVEVISVTAGEASHPRSRAAATTDLRTVRALELRAALGRLGWATPSVLDLELPDGEVALYEEHLTDTLSALALPDDLWVVPWRHDGHPDHEASARATVRACDGPGARVLESLIWTWHWADPTGEDIPWQRCWRLDLSQRERARKRWSTGAFRSQIEPLGDEPGDAAILPPSILRRFWRPYEIFVDERCDE
jgi:LmbE family N-acetylglucosaminyl deacetylase